MNTLKTYRFKGMMFFFLLIFLLMYEWAGAQSDTTNKPYLGVHSFTPVTYPNTPFTNTYSSILTGFGQTTDLVHQLGSIGNYQPRGLVGEVTFITVSFSYQQHVRERLAAYINLSLSTRVGTELQSILTQGINTLNSFDIGWNIKLISGDKFALSSVVELQNQRGSFINISKYFIDLTNNYPNPSIKETIPVLTFGTGFRFAYGLSDLIGFKASTDLVYGETYNRGENGFAYSAVGGIDLNFNSRYSIPFAYVMYYSISSMPDFVYVKDESAHIIKSKIAYSRSTEFSFGLEYSYMKVPLLNQQKRTTFRSIALAIHFYF